MTYEILGATVSPSRLRVISALKAPRQHSPEGLALQASGMQVLNESKALLDVQDAMDRMKVGDRAGAAEALRRVGGARALEVADMLDLEEYIEEAKSVEAARAALAVVPPQNTSKPVPLWVMIGGGVVAAWALFVIAWRYLR